MKKRVFCVLWTALLALCLAHAVAETVEIKIGSVSFRIHDSFERYGDVPDTLMYMTPRGDIVYAFVMDSRPDGPAIYENPGQLISLITSFRDSSMPTAEIIAFDECAALYEVTDRATLVIFNKYEVTSIFVASDNDELQQLYVDLILASAVSKESPLQTSSSNAFADEEFTVEVDQYDFKIFLPASFKQDEDFPEDYRPTYTRFYPYVEIKPNPKMNFFPVDAKYTDREALRSTLEQYATSRTDNKDQYEVIEMDECLGLLDCWQGSSGTYFVYLNVTNRKDVLHMIVISDDRNEALDLAHAIIDHSVAKEIPLEELEQAE